MKNKKLNIQSKLKALHQEFLEYAQTELWAVHYHWVRSINRKFKILDIELEKEIHGEEQETEENETNNQTN